MKLKIRTSTREGFSSRFILQHGDDGVVVATDDLLFRSRKQKEEVRDKFIDFVTELQFHGIEVEGLENIKL